MVVPRVVRVVVPEVVRSVAKRQDFLFSAPSCEARGAPANVTPVEHACYKCQSMVEEGIPFCPHCGAPQIRVVPPEATTEQSLTPVSDELRTPPPTTSTSPWGPPRATFPPREPIQWNQVWQGALLAGVGAALLSSLPFLALGSLLWLLIAGALSVSMYQRRVPSAIVKPGMGMRIGALAGGFAFVITAILSTVLFATEGNQLRQMMEEQLRASMAKAPDPRSAEILQQFISKLGTPEGLATFFLWVMAFIAVLFILFSAAGGALGASVSARRRGNT